MYVIIYDWQANYIRIRITLGGTSGPYTTVPVFHNNIYKETRVREIKLYVLRAYDVERRGILCYNIQVP